MAPDTKNTATAHRYAWFVLPLAGILLGASATYLWLGESVVVSDQTRPLTPHAQVQSLRVIPAQALYMETFKAPEILPHVWQEMQNIIAAKQQLPQVAKPTGTSSLLGRLLQPLAPVQTAQAGTSGPVPTAPSQKITPPPAGTTAVPNKPQAAPAANAAPAAASPAPKASTESPDTFNTGTLGQLTLLRAELEQLKMQVSIEETRSRLNQLRGFGAPEPKKSVPSLDYPPIGMPADMPAPAKKQLRILSIQSINGKYAATVSTASGPRVVKVNDAVGDGRVVSITRNSVVINRGQGNETLSIQD